ncbi:MULTISPECIES: endolytic transglycosylase MltG [unclassified Streptomyces]|uniref:endolytic transglycosylase MltG n=1 Tax=unclassified Streptomyces TaxID=2593676 RepID=UPI000DC77833|nr:MULTISPECIES: endolytic transglycosylase MltG [unclassified Streptomyces]AWZ04625.1 endolytic transglycosylase MltG [Streptomyces sp. ICC4]AWZ11626.1 endolytic transglycosylase MltG [Streptomyces sp. ICC1]
MTEYGRGPGPEPWHPEDPQYGDQGWTGHEAQQGQMPYIDGQQQYPQEPQYQQQVQYPQQTYQPEQQYQQQQYQQYQQQPQQQYQQHQGTYGGQGWDTGQVPVGLDQNHGFDPNAGFDHGAGFDAGYVNAAQAADPYAGADPYAQQQTAGYPGETPDLYGTPEAFPPPRPPGRRHLEPEEQWQEEAPAEEPEESFLAGGGGGRDDGDDDEPGGRRSGRSGGKPKKRSGMACLIASVVIIGVLGGGGYYGYSYLKDKFGAAEDFAGAGIDEAVDVEIPKGAGLGQMGRILKEKGVVASAQAFVDAATANPDGKKIQPGIYPLKKKMSAASAVAVMVDPTKLHVLTITEGMRNSTVYDAIDKKLEKPAGTTKDIAFKEAKNLGLPAWANNDPKIMDPLEGFLYPMRYDLSKDSTPESLLKQMVKNATDKYMELGIEGKAKDLGLSNPLQVVTVASLVNAEGKNHDDFRKMAEVVYNRLKKTNDISNQKIEFDSTYNYVKGTSEINFNLTEARNFVHPYNTHNVRGLPPGPIGNPGLDAVTATLNPDGGGWMFFVSVDGDKTSFSKTYDEHLKLVAEFQARQKQKNGG